MTIAPRRLQNNDPLACDVCGDNLSTKGAWSGPVFFEGEAVERLAWVCPSCYAKENVVNEENVMSDEAKERYEAALEEIERAMWTITPELRALLETGEHDFDEVMRKTIRIAENALAAAIELGDDVEVDVWTEHLERLPPRFQHLRAQ